MIFNLFLFAISALQKTLKLPVSIREFISTSFIFTINIARKNSYD